MTISISGIAARHNPSSLAEARRILKDLGIRQIIAGIMTLDALPIEGAPDGVHIYAARWIEQVRGTSVRVVDGFIAVSGYHSYHGPSAEKALAGLRRKIAGAAWAAHLRTTNLDDLVPRISDIVVRLADARAIGACEYGIRSWCDRAGLSYEAGKATVSEIYAAYQKFPAPEARGAILHAARRERRLSARRARRLSAIAA